ncbi:MAG: TerB N-terminal domain-containing protein [Lachnospiraceae bacterium]|nr:TerB N-terminal domain-containing protein [Lachnospiraceae bacterium]
MMQEVSVRESAKFLIKRYAIPDDVAELLWIRGKEQTYDHNLLNEPSLIDTNLEVKYDKDNLVQDIDYYPNYRELTAENRHVYLSWLSNVSAPIPMGYIFIFYYGLERHLIFGKFEQAFNMIVKLRMYHNNNSFNAYSADALLIAALYHKKPDLIGKIDLNKATPKLAQFVIASLTGKLESDLLIESCGNVGFTNKRYIKSDYNLYVKVFNEVLSEKFGYAGYPIEKEDFLKCKETFPLVLANYSLKAGERIANAPDLDTNEEFRKNVFAFLSEAHERVKEHKKRLRSKKNNA